MCVSFFMSLNFVQVIPVKILNLVGKCLCATVSFRLICCVETKLTGDAFQS